MLELREILNAIGEAGVVEGVHPFAEEMFLKGDDLRDGVVFEADGEFAFGEGQARLDFGWGIQG